MKRRELPAPDEAVRELIRQEAERRLTAEELEAYVRAPMSDEELEDILSLIAWHIRRYPTPLERLAHARRAELHLASSPLSGGFRRRS